MEKSPYETALDTVDVYGMTLREFINACMKELLVSGEDFSGKRPVCDSGWEFCVDDGVEPLLPPDETTSSFLKNCVDVAMSASEENQRFRGHSILLNRIMWDLGVALGDIPDDVEEWPAEDTEEFILNRLAAAVDAIQAQRAGGVL